MSYNLDKKNGRIARQTANTVFGVCGAIIGLALGGRPSTRPSTRISRPSGPRRRKLW